MTAKHVLPEEPPKEIEIEWDEWVTIPVQLVGKGAGNQDVAVLASKTHRLPLAPAPVALGYDILWVGQSVRFLGFQPTVRTNLLPNNRKQMAPLVRAGIVSGTWLGIDKGDEESIWIDGQASSGFSGSPLVYQPAQVRNEQGCTWGIAGVIANYVTENVAAVTVDGRPQGHTTRNTGLVRAIPITAVVKLIRANPIGHTLE